LVFCQTCGQCLGEERPYYAEEHLKQFPEHRMYLVKAINDPLVLADPDKWFNKHIPLMRRKLTESKNDDELVDYFDY